MPAISDASAAGSKTILESLGKARSSETLAYIPHKKGCYIPPLPKPIQTDVRVMFVCRKTHGVGQSPCICASKAPI